MTIDASAVARVVGIDVQYKDLRGGKVVYLPQRIAVFAQGRSDVDYSLTKFQATSSKQVCDRMGYGGPAGLIARELFPANGDGVGSIPVTFYPLEDAYEAVAASATITPSGTQTAAGEYYVRIAGERSNKFVVTANMSMAERCDAIVAAINGALHMPMIATDNTTAVGLEAKWAGASGNDLVIEVVGESLGTVWGITQPNGGLVNPEVDDALAQVGGVWETLLLNALNISDTDALDAFQTFGEGRWGELEHKPCMVFTGNTAAAVSSAIAVSDARKSDRVNGQLVAPGSPELPCVVAARQLVRIAKVANNNPPHDYGGQRADGLIPGTDGQQWNYAQRQQAVLGGSSTMELRDGVVAISDVVTFHHPDGDPTPAYRYGVDQVKIQNIVFNVNLIFARTDWNGAPLIPDNQPTVNPTAKKPSMAIAEVAALIDNLALNAIISDPASAKESIVVEIDSQNPKRLNVTFTVKLSGNTNIISVALNFGFFFGEQQLAA